MAKFRKVKNNRKNSPTRGMIYGRAVVNRVVHTSAIAKNITERCTVTEPDILAVINALMTEISANIAEGNKVVLDNFGSFKLGIRTSPAVSAKKFTSANIKAMYIYSPYSVMDQGKRVKPMLSGIKMEEMTEYNGIEDKENDGGTSGGTSGGGTSGGTDKDNTGDTSGGTDKDNPSGGNTPSGDTGKDNTGDGEGGGGDNVNF